MEIPSSGFVEPIKPKVLDESGAIEGNTIGFIRNDQGSDKQFEYFVPNRSSGFTLKIHGRINQSVLANGYCILGAQANTRKSILGGTGTAANTQTDFLVLIEDALKTLTISNGPSEYQNAVNRKKVQLNFAVPRGVFLLPSRMIINTESVVGYNNNLKEATDDPKLGVNNPVNLGTHKSSLKPMAGGSSKINPPNSHSLKPNPEKATEAQGVVKKKPTPTPTPTQTQTQTKATDTPTPVTQTTTDPDDTHHINKALVGVGVLVVVGFVFWASK